jgi:hypothetical protein
MGGFFVRKLAGAAALTVHLQKMLPLLFHASGAKWIHGHFQAVLWCGLLANCAILAFYASYMEDLMNFEAAELPKLLMGLLTTESLVFVYYLFTTRTAKRGPAIAMTNGKTETSVASKIVARTIAIVSGVTCVIALRDLLLPGYIFDFIPRDDIYLEWTNVFLHSPPDGTPESNDQGLEAPLFVGDKFIAQFAALHILLCCMYKFVSCFWIRYGSDGSGAITSGMFWKTQTIGDALLLFNFRLFSSSANSASLDLRWHLMALAYETFILGTVMKGMDLFGLYDVLVGTSYLSACFLPSIFLVRRTLCFLLTLTRETLLIKKQRTVYYYT